ncbi:MAG: AGE family epimerase/isomerase, partial [Fibrella sp.]|nr:AGE family epimerase/isomerase [Armatimonadota bacterium]
AYCSGPNGTDKYYDDNQWIVLADLEAFEATRDRSFLREAWATQKFVLSGWDEKLGGGIYWDLKHQTKNTCSNAPAAASALRLYQLTKDKEQLKWAIKIRDWVKANLRDEDGLYWDNMRLDGNIEKTKWSYNTALMIRTDVLFYQLTGDKASLVSARQSADTGLAAWTDPATGSLHKTDASPIFTHLFCEALLRLYDVTKDKKYLEAAQKEADFSYRFARDPKGGYWNDWNAKEHPADERKKLIVNASAARLFWLLAPYPEAGKAGTPMPRSGVKNVL